MLEDEPQRIYDSACDVTMAAAAAEAKAMYSAIVLGATGNVGGRIVQLLIKNPLCEKVVVVTRFGTGYGGAILSHDKNFGRKHGSEGRAIRSRPRGTLSRRFARAAAQRRLRTIPR